MMAKIYAHATRVLVWLEETGDSGNSTIDSGPGLEELRVMASRRFKSPLDTEEAEARDKGRQAIRSLLSRSWFKRVWIS